MAIQPYHNGGLTSRTVFSEPDEAGHPKPPKLPPAYSDWTSKKEGERVEAPYKMKLGRALLDGFAALWTKDRPLLPQLIHGLQDSGPWILRPHALPHPDLQGPLGTVSALQHLRNMPNGAGGWSRTNLSEGPTGTVAWKRSNNQFVVSGVRNEKPTLALGIEGEIGGAMRHGVINTDSETDWFETTGFDVWMNAPTLEGLARLLALNPKIDQGALLKAAAERTVRYDPSYTWDGKTMNDMEAQSHSVTLKKGDNAESRVTLHKTPEGWSLAWQLEGSKALTRSFTESIVHHITGWAGGERTDDWLTRAEKKLKSWVGIPMPASGHQLPDWWASQEQERDRAALQLENVSQLSPARETAAHTPTRSRSRRAQGMPAPTLTATARARIARVV